MRISTDPSPSSAALAMASGAPGCIKSNAMMTSFVFSSSCNSSSRLRRRATTARRTPSRAKAAAIPRPIPMLAPVTSAVRPLMPSSIGKAAILPDYRHADCEGKALLASARSFLLLHGDPYEPEDHDFRDRPRVRRAGARAIPRQDHDRPQRFEPCGAASDLGKPGAPRQRVGFDDDGPSHIGG